MHQDVLSQVRNDAGAASQIDVVVDRQGTMIMGRPVISSSYFPDFVSTTGSASFLTVGDLSGFTLANRLGVTVELIPQMRDNSGRPIGERGFMAYARVGANVTVPTSQVLLANS
jgi:HK97 family phage major capsid protein